MKESNRSEDECVTPMKRNKVRKLILLIVVVVAVIGFVAFLRDYSTNLDADAEANGSSLASVETSSTGTNGRVEMDRGVYTGNLLNGNPDGKGSFKFNTGESYEGDWKNSEMDGKGKLVYPDYGTYTGEFAAGKRNGLGTFQFKNGDIFKGEWSGDKPNKGKYTFAGGAWFKGSLKNDVFCDGDLFYKNKAENIIKLHIHFSDASSDYIDYVGTDGYRYKGDVGEGIASIVYKNKDTYHGDVSNWKKEGIGIYRWKINGKTVAYYNGSWKSGKMNGTGTYHYTNSQYPCLKGKFKSNKPTGICKYYRKKGLVYKTKWNNGVCVKSW